MGSGKSTAGRKIAAALRWHFTDLDKVIIEQQGLTIGEMFEQHGEDYFRDAERKALIDISARSKMVVACGGGTPCNDANISVMKSTGVLLYLKMTVPALVSRLLVSKGTRPLLTGIEENGMKAKVEELFAERSQWYERADIVTDGMNINIEEITGLLAAHIRDAGAFL